MVAPSQTSWPQGTMIPTIRFLRYIQLHTSTSIGSLSIPTHSAQFSAFTGSVPHDHAPEVLLAYAQRATAPLLPEQGPDLVSGVVTMDDATFTTLLSLSSGASATSRFNCRALLDIGSPHRSFTKEPLIKCLPPALPTHPTSEPPHPNLGADSAPNRCSALADRSG